VASIDAAPAEAVLTARDLYRFFHTGDDEIFALRGVSLDVERGEVVAIMGPSGSGKSTLLRCLAGLEEPDGGRVSVAGSRITRRPESERSALRGRWIGVLQQAGNLIEHLSVRENIAFARTFSDRRRARTDDELLADVGLEERGDARPSRLSGGEAARAGLAVALANDPPILLADEPTAEVDQANERLVIELLRRRASYGYGVVIVTHGTRVAAAADRIVHLRDGNVADV
jgi:putative ABC transport system ATP-binding protein